MSDIGQKDLPEIEAIDLDDLCVQTDGRAFAYSERTVTVGNCSFAFVCSKRWSELEEDLLDPNKRLCATCQKHVFWCSSPEEFARRGRAGECVAIDFVETHEPELLGMPSFDDEGQEVY